MNFEKKWEYRPLFDLARRASKDPSAEVYVWLTTSILDNRKNGCNYESNSRHNKEAQTLRRSVGHVAIKVTLGGQSIYASFCPAAHYKDIELINPMGSFVSSFNTYESDTNTMKSGPDEIIVLENLDFERMFQFLKYPGNDWKYYNLYRRNCSSLVIKALKIGANNRKPTFFNKVKQIGSDLMDFPKASGWFFFLFTNPAQRLYFMRVAQNDSNVLRIPDHLFKYLGGQTPDAVLRYARFLVANYQVKGS